MEANMRCAKNPGRIQRQQLAESRIRGTKSSERSSVYRDVKRNLLRGNVVVSLRSAPLEKAKLLADHFNKLRKGTSEISQSFTKGHVWIHFYNWDLGLSYTSVSRGRRRIRRPARSSSTATCTSENSNHMSPFLPISDHHLLPPITFFFSPVTIVHYARGGRRRKLKR